jgi:hypothetical protein
MEAYLFSFVAPYLAAAVGIGALMRLAGVEISKRPVNIIVAAAALILVLLPVKQVPTARFVAGFNANFSITLSALLLGLLLRQLHGIRLFDRRALRTISVCGLIVGPCLYAGSMNLAPFDLYRYGWGSIFLLAPLFILTVCLIAGGNRAGYVLAAAVAAYGLRLLESDNLWDYLLDPFVIGWCLIASLAECLSGIWSLVGRRLRNKNPGRSTGSESALL